MLTQIVGSLGSAIVAFSRYRISALGVRKFLTEVAGFYAIDELVDQAKPYSKWVEEHEDELVLGLSLGMMAKNSLGKLLAGGTLGAKSRVLFSKIPLANSARAFGAWAKNYTVKASHHGVTILENGKEIITLAKNGSQIAMNHSGKPATAALLAAGLGGLIPATRDEWEASGEQLAAQLGDLELSIADASLRSRLLEFSPTTLMRTGDRIIESFIRENPSFSAEKAVSIMMEILQREDTVAGSHSIDGFVDADGDTVIRIDGTFFKREERDETFVLVPSTPAEGPKLPLSVDEQGILAVLKLALEKVSQEGGLSLMRVAKTDRFISTPFSVGRYCLALVIDLENPVPTFVFSEGSWVYFGDTARENLEDDIDEQGIEMVVRWAKSVPSLFDFSDDRVRELEQETDFARKVHTILPLLGATYRNGIIRLDSEDLNAGLGKFRLVKDLV